jgi:hypothetical protein
MSGVYHYLDHGEPEMAMEGLLIELINTNRYPVSFDISQWESVAHACGLPEGGVFDAVVWKKFCAWKDRYRA